MTIRIALRIGGAAIALYFASGCTDSSAAQTAAGQTSTATKPAQVTTQGYSDGGDKLRILTHDEILPVGFPESRAPVTSRNPFEGDKRALGIGAQLFVAYNCVDCHGADGAGAMGPGFQDGRWHFGGSAAAVFESIYQGRPEGMPSWGGRITDDQIWMLATYVRSLATADMSTENFSGQTIERTGH